LAPAVQLYGPRIPGQDAAVQILNGDGIVGVAHHHGQAEQFVGFLQGLPGADDFRDVHKGDHRAFDHIVQGAVGLNPHGVPPGFQGLHFDLDGNQGLHYGCGICH